MKRLLLSAAIGALLLAGCSQKAEDLSATDTQSVVAADASKNAAHADIPTVPSLAYRYRYAIETPADQVRRLMSVHEQACRNAGPTVCQLISQTAQDQGRHGVEGDLRLRARADWLGTFRDGLAGQAEAAGGKLSSSEVASEDLTAQMVDVEAQLQAKTALRDRLKTLVASRPGKLADLLQVENELARVQGEIDAARSGLAIMRARVAMSELTVHYATLAGWTSAWAPLTEAPRESADSFAVVASAALRLAIWLSPWLVIGWMGWTIWRRRRPGAKPAG